MSWGVINLHRIGIDLFLRAGDGPTANPWGGQASGACGPLNQVPMSSVTCLVLHGAYRDHSGCRTSEASGKWSEYMKEL